ncbi:MAG: NAD(P)-binding protein [Candidatus Parcubacteria bacterium]|nr:NAD(P)-binding protein [Candidatus Parcubacteria bacterium]
MGLYLAWRLRQKGYEVVVFEKKDRVGGKPCTALISERIKSVVRGIVISRSSIICWIKSSR